MGAGDPGSNPGRPIYFKQQTKMAEKEKFGSVKRYGVRYGRINKIKVAKLETSARSKHKCPYCSYSQVKRQSAGIWNCGRCESTFAGRAYSPTSSKRV